MKNILIIYPHWPPSNLAGVHRARLVANYLREFDWQPIVLTVEAAYYEETPDQNIERTVSKEFEVIYTKAFRVMKLRLIGDIGIRSFSFLYRKALEIISLRKIDFIWIPIPSFYTALLGPKLYNKTGVPYGIDYIDPWVRDISNRKDWRHKLSNQLAKFLEPIAVKKASLITGVAYEYYRPVLERNFAYGLKLKAKSIRHEEQMDENSYSVHHSAFPYGFDPNDHKIKLDHIKYPWSDEKNIKSWIYAGAFLPNSRIFMEQMFCAIAGLREHGVWDEQIRMYFIGTGSYPGKRISAYAQEAGISDIVSEDRSRYPFLHVLNFLSAADTVLVLGSTEKHYTASKVYQSLLSERPVWAIFHEESSAVKVMQECRADQYLVRYKEGMKSKELRNAIKRSLLERLKEVKWKPDLDALDKYSAKESARKLVEGIETALSMSSRPQGEALG